MNDYIPFYKPYFPENMRKRILEEYDIAMINGDLSNGEKVRQLEERVAKMSGADYAVACGCCSIGLQIATGAAGVAGMTGVTQSFTWASTVIAINAVAGSVHYLDIDYDYWTIKEFPVMPDRAYALAVDTFGMQFRPRSRIPLFYDRAHSLGQRFGHIGNASVLSFSPSKICPAGEGGMILTNNANFESVYREACYKVSRMSTVHAITALEQLTVLPDVLEWKKETYNFYKRKFPQFKFQEGQGNHQVIGMLVDTNEMRDNILLATGESMELKAYYKPLHTETNGTWNLPVTTDVANRIICLPSWYGVDRDKVVERIEEAIE